jgi:hypothetical protein
MKVTEQEVTSIYFMLTLGIMSNMISRDQAKSIVNTLKIKERPADLQKWVDAEIKKLEE